MAKPVSLPHLPRLPPIDLQNSPAASDALFPDSFPSAFHPNQPSSPTSQPRQSLSPPLSLRKSISVDSFVTSPSFPSPRLQRDPHQIPSRGFVAGLTSAFRRDSTTDLRSGRNRGASVSSVRDQHQPDSDLDHHPLPDRDQRFRLQSVKGPDPSRLPVRAGELPLPARTSSSINDFSTPLSPTSSSDHMNMNYMNYPSHPPPHHPPPPPPPPRRVTNVPINTGRARSVSIGTQQSQPPPKRMIINTQLSSAPPPPLPVMSENVTLIVIGSPGCGKTQAIRKGLSGFNLSDPLPSTVQRVVGHTSLPMYSYRLGTIVRDKVPDCPLTIIEIDILLADGHIPRNHLWPEAVPCIDGAVICYDSADHASFKPVELLLRAYHAMRLPIIVLACKADSEPQIEPEYASRLLQQYRAGLVEVTVLTDTGKDKLKRSFDWLLKAVFRHRKAIETINQPDNTYLNPASPDVLVSPPTWENSRTTTPTVAQPQPPPPFPPHSLPSPPSHLYLPPSQPHQPPHIQPPGTTTISPPIPTAQGQNGGVETRVNQPRPQGKTATDESDGNMSQAHPVDDGDEPIDPSLESSRQPPSKEKDKPKPAQFATLDTLLDKLLFIAVSGDDPCFIPSFLLTYRRFCTPRSVLLAMQKKMRLLDEPSGDPMFSCFAQMRICHLLEVWISEFPTDFAVKGTAGALHALIRSILSKTHLLHYGSQLLPFLEVLPSLEDQDAVWALEPEIAESDGESLVEEEDDLKLDGMNIPSHWSTSSVASAPLLPPPPPPPVSSIPSGSSSNNSRERKPSLPLVKSFGFTLNNSPDSDPSSKQQLKDLLKIASEVLILAASDVAEEITRVEAKYFLDITDRDWMHFVFLKHKKPDDPIVAFNTIANHIGDWVVSLILCHEKPQKRAKQMEKMVDIAARLRSLNNYSALRAFVAGINNATYPGDETMEIFKSRSPEQAKNLQSWEVLLRQLGAHRAYRLALRNSKGSCIPALEVHIADMIKAQDANKDFREGDATKIHWAKFSMMGRFVSITTQCQNQCRNSTDYNFPDSMDRRRIRELFTKRAVMGLEMQRARLKDPEVGDYGLLPNQDLPKRDARAIRGLFFW